MIGGGGSWVICPLLLASTLLTGCNGNSASSAGAAASSAPNGVASQSIFGSTLARAAATGSTSSPAASPPAATDKSVDVTWTAPTTNTNGSALTDLAGYTVYYGSSPSQLTQSVKIPNAGASDYVVQGLAGGTWYFAVRSYTSAGLQSSYSTVVSRTIT
jgi:predicted small secreted protein